MTKAKARRLRREHSARATRADAPHYTRADIGTVYVADRLHIDVDAAERLTARPRTVLVGDCTPVTLLVTPAPRGAEPLPRPRPTLTQLLAPPSTVPRPVDIAAPEAITPRGTADRRESI